MLPPPLPPPSSSPSSIPSTTAGSFLYPVFFLLSLPWFCGVDKIVLPVETSRWSVSEDRWAFIRNLFTSSTPCQRSSLSMRVF
jgi:hypothetical protein